MILLLDNENFHETVLMRKAIWSLVRICFKDSFLMLHAHFWSSVYNRALVYKRQNFLKIVVHVIMADQCNQTAR